MTRNVTVTCPICESSHPVRGTVSHDPGCWRTSNGDGWPESWEVDFDSEQCPAVGDSPDLYERIEDELVAAFKMEWR